MTRRKTSAARGSVEPVATAESQKRTHARHGFGTRYSDADKLRAVVAMYVANREHPYSEDSLRAARAALGTPVSNDTLTRWIGQYTERALAVVPRATDEQIAAATGETTIEAAIDFRDKLINHLRQPDVIKGADFRSAAVAWGIAVDKLDKMAGIDSETAIIVKRLSALCTAVGWDTKALLVDLTDLVARRTNMQQPRLSSDTLPSLPATTDGDTVDAT